MSYKAVIFDLDGTLVNTIGDLTNSMNYALERAGLGLRSKDECSKMVGNGVVEFARRAIGDKSKEFKLDEVLGYMKEHYGKNYFAETRPFDGICELIESLKDRGIKLAVVTNKHHESAENVVEHFFGKDTFDYIGGEGQGRALKPDPRVTLDAADKLGVSTDQAVFVGDSDVDMITARKTNMKAVGVSWGYRSVEELKRAGADVIVDRPSEIADMI